MSVAFVSEILTPLETVERIASQERWDIEVIDDDNLVMFVEGRWTEYEVAYSWMPEEEVLHLACGFEMRVTKRRLPEFYDLARKVNDLLWIGGFEYYPQAKMILFRHGCLCPKGEAPSANQVLATLQMALKTCEEHYSAFELVCKQAKTADQALSMNIGATQGSA